eukprot:7385242-Prymnesium_polylepis.1
MFGPPACREVVHAAHPKHTRGCGMTDTLMYRRDGAAMRMACRLGSHGGCCGCALAVAPRCASTDTFVSL